MDVEASLKSIRDLFQTLTGTSGAKVSLIYSGYEAGITKPWQARVEAREQNHESADGALTALFNELKLELNKKAASTQWEADKLRKFLATLEN